MAKHTIVGDVRLSDYLDQGDPIRFTNQEIRRMCRLANLGRNDVFYDLGSGWGQNLIIALTEFDARTTVGIERDRGRCEVAVERLKNWSLANRSKVVPGDFEDLLFRGLEGADLSEATVIFYGLTTTTECGEAIARRAPKGCRLLYYFNGLFPEILPDRADFPFYVSVSPFKKPKTEHEWLKAVVQKEQSSVNPGQRPSVQELWDELSHDCEIYGDIDAVSDYRGRLKRTVGSQ